MEVRAAGSLPAARGAELLALLAALSGQEPAALELREVVMRCETPTQREVELQRTRKDAPRELHLTRTSIPAAGGLPAAHRSDIRRAAH